MLLEGNGRRRVCVGGDAWKKAEEGGGWSHEKNQSSSDGSRLPTTTQHVGRETHHRS